MTKLNELNDIQHLSVLLLFSLSVTSNSSATPWMVAHKAPLSMGFPRQEYWSGLPFPPPGDLPDPEMEPKSPALADGFFTTESPGKPSFKILIVNFILFKNFANISPVPPVPFL